MFSFLTNAIVGKTTPHIQVFGSEEPRDNETLLEKMRKAKSVGRFDGLEERAQEILQTEHYCFRGVQFSLQNILDKHFLTAHTVELGKKETIGPDGKPQGDTAAYGMTSYLKHGNWMLNGRMGTGGTRGKVEYSADSWSASAQGNFSEDPNRSHLELDLSKKVGDMNFELKCSDFVAYGISYTSPLAWQGAVSSWKAGMDVYMTLDDRARLKGIVQYAPPQTGEEISVVASTGLGPDQISLQYMQKMGPHVNLFTEANYSFTSDKQTKKKDWVSTWKLGYSYSTRDDSSLNNLPTPSIRATADTSANIAVLLEEPLSDFLMANFTLKGNPISNDYDVGLGFTVTI